MASKFKQGGTPLDELPGIILWKSDTFTDAVRFTPTPAYDEPTDINYVKNKSGVLNDKWGDVLVRTDYNMKDADNNYVPLPLADKISCPILNHYNGSDATISDALSSPTAPSWGWTHKEDQEATVNKIKECKHKFNKTPLYIRAVNDDFGKRIEVNTSSNVDSWVTVKEGHTGFWFTLVGGGGGGAWFNYGMAWVTGGGGGGGGGVIIGYISLPPNGPELKVTTGTGGGTVKNSSGSDGTASTITWTYNGKTGTIKVSGGKGGKYPTNSSTSALGGAGGGASTTSTPNTITDPTGLLVSYVAYEGGNGGEGSSSENSSTFMNGWYTGSNVLHYKVGSSASTGVSNDTHVYGFGVFNTDNQRLIWHGSTAAGHGGLSTTSYSGSSDDGSFSYTANGGGGGGSLMGGYRLTKNSSGVTTGHTTYGYGYGGFGASTSSSTPDGNVKKIPIAGGDGCFMMYV